MKIHARLTFMALLATYARAEELYLVGGNSGRMSSGKYAVKLYQVQSGIPALQRVVVSAAEGAEFIQQNSDAGMIVIGQQSDGSVPSKLFVIKQERPQIVHVISTGLSSLGLFSSKPPHFLRIPQKGDFFGLYGGTSVANRRYVGIQLTPTVGSALLDLDPADAKGMLASGTAGAFGTSNFDLVPIQVDEKGVVFTRFIEGRVDLPLQSTPSGMRKSFDSVWLSVNNREIAVISSGSPEDAERNVHLVYSQARKTWTKWVDTANESTIRGHGRWLVSNPVERKSREELELIRRKAAAMPRAQRMGERSAEPLSDPATQTGPAVRDRTDSPFRYPGVLRLYDSASGTVREIHTSNPDSEVVAVIKDVAYYREGDELRRVKLVGRRDSLAQDELVAKGGEILDIHWLFVK